jgi:hypothetical protein
MTRAPSSKSGSFALGIHLRSNTPAVQPEETVKAYFHKQLFSTPCYLSTGSAAPFVAFGDDEGYLVTSHEWLIGELRDCQKRGVGGVTEVTEDALAELKKSPRETPTSRRSPIPKSSSSRRSLS